MPYVRILSIECLVTLFIPWTTRCPFTGTYTITILDAMTQGRLKWKGIGFIRTSKNPWGHMRNPWDKGLGIHFTDRIEQSLQGAPKMPPESGPSLKGMIPG